MNTIGKYTPFNTIIHRLDARVKLISLIAIMVFVFLDYGNGYMNLLIYLLLFIAGLVLTIISKTSFLQLLKSLKALWFMMIFIVLLNLFVSTNSTGEVAFKINTLNVTYSAIVNCIYIILRLVLVLMSTNIFSSTTKPLDITNALEWLLYPLKFIKVPIAKIAMAISLALRFIPKLQDETFRIMKAQASRGVDFKHGKFKDKMTAIISLITPLFISAFTMSGELADAMEARGYDPDCERTKYRSSLWEKKDTITCIILAIVSIVLITICITKVNVFDLLGIILPRLK